jgi:hypothetical protein
LKHFAHSTKGPAILKRTSSSLIFYFVAIEEKWRLPIHHKCVPKPILARGTGCRIMRQQPGKCHEFTVLGQKLWKTAKLGQFLLPVWVSGSNSYFGFFLSKISMNVTTRISVYVVHVQTLLVVSHVPVMKVI